MCRGDELLLTEMIFNGAFNDLTIEQCVSLLSCFVFQEKVITIHSVGIRGETESRALNADDPLACYLRARYQVFILNSIDYYSNF